jgi:hypothetical protein
MTARTLTSSLCLAALLLAGGVHGAHAATPKGFKVYTSVQWHFRVAYPSTWHLMDKAAVPWFMDGTTQHHPNGVVLLQAYPTVMPSIDTFVGMVMKGFKKDTSHFKITHTRVAGGDGRLITGITKSGDPYAIAAFTGHQSRTWTAILGAKPTTYGRELKIFAAMLATFTFTP